MSAVPYAFHSKTADNVGGQTATDFLRANACDKIQGYIISEPVNEIEFNLLLEKPR